MRIRTKGNSVIFSKIKRPKREGVAVGAGFVNLERESVTSLYIFGHSDRRLSMEKKAKSIYVARATRGHRFGGVPTTPRGRDLFLLVIFFS